MTNIGGLAMNLDQDSWFSQIRPFQREHSIANPVGAHNLNDLDRFQRTKAILFEPEHWMVILECRTSGSVATDWNWNLLKLTSFAKARRQSSLKQLKFLQRKALKNLPVHKCRTFHWLRAVVRSWPQSNETKWSDQVCRSPYRSGWKRCRILVRTPGRLCFESLCRDPYRPALVDIYCLAMRRSRTAVSASRPVSGWR